MNKKIVACLCFILNVFTISSHNLHPVKYLINWIEDISYKTYCDSISKLEAINVAGELSYTKSQKVHIVYCKSTQLRKLIRYYNVNDQYSKYYVVCFKNNHFYIDSENTLIDKSMDYCFIIGNKCILIKDYSKIETRLKKKLFNSTSISHSLIYSSTTTSQRNNEKSIIYTINYGKLNYHKIPVIGIDTNSVHIHPYKTFIKNNQDRMMVSKRYCGKILNQLIYQSEDYFTIGYLGIDQLPCQRQFSNPIQELQVSAYKRGKFVRKNILSNIDGCFIYHNNWFLVYGTHSNIFYEVTTDSVEYPILCEDADGDVFFIKKSETKLTHAKSIVYEESPKEVRLNKYNLCNKQCEKLIYDYIRYNVERGYSDLKYYISFHADFYKFSITLNAFPYWYAINYPKMGYLLVDNHRCLLLGERKHELTHVFNILKETNHTTMFQFESFVDDYSEMKEKMIIGTEGSHTEELNKKDVLQLYQSPVVSYEIVYNQVDSTLSFVKK